MLDTGIDSIINQVVNPKIQPLILPCVQDTVFAYLKANSAHILRGTELGEFLSLFFYILIFCFVALLFINI